jgi:hypothetical protein
VYVVHNYKKSQVQTRIVHKSFVSAFTVEEHISCCMTAAR